MVRGRNRGGMLEDRASRCCCQDDAAAASLGKRGSKHDGPLLALDVEILVVWVVACGGCSAWESEDGAAFGCFDLGVAGSNSRRPRWRVRQQRMTPEPPPFCL